MQAVSVPDTLGLRLAVAIGQRNVDDGRGHELVLAIGLRLSILHALLVEDASKIRDRLGIDRGRRRMILGTCTVALPASGKLMSGKIAGRSELARARRCALARARTPGAVAATRRRFYMVFNGAGR